MYVDPVSRLLFYPLRSTILSEECADGSCQQQASSVRQEDSASDILPSISLLFNSEDDDGSVAQRTEEEGQGGEEEEVVVDKKLVKEEDKEGGLEVDSKGDDMRLAKDDKESDQTSRVNITKLDEPVVEDLTPANKGCETGTKRFFAFFKRQRKRSAVTPGKCFTQ